MASNLWVAVGSGGNTIATSTNGTVWTGLGASSPITQAGRCIAYGKDGSGNNVWVAVGQGGNTIAYSTNGTTWSGFANTIFSTSGYKVLYDPNATLWIAVGLGNNSIATTSYPTISWTGQGVIFPSNLTGSSTNSVYGPAINYSGTSDITGYVIGGYSNGPFIAYSLNGTTWQMASGTNGLNAVGMGAIAYGNGIYVAGGIPNTGGNSFATSTNLITWTGRGGSSLTGYVSQIAFGNGVFITAGSKGASGSSIMRSTDGITWTNLFDAYSSGGGRCVAYYNGRWFVGGVAGAVHWSENDGNSWTSSSSSINIYSNQTRSFGFGNGVIASVGFGTSNTLAISNDFGVNWIGKGPLLVGYGNDVKFNNGVWLASGGNNTSSGNILVKSTDNGVSWTQIVTYNTEFFTSLIGVQNVNGRWYINGRGTYFIAYSTTNNPTSISDFTMVSSSQASFASGSTYSVMFNFQKPKYIVGGQGMKGSTNGLTWFDIVNQPFLRVMDVHWNGTLWVGVGAGVSNGKHTIAYSYDGINWIGIGATIFTSVGTSVYYSKPHSLWVATGNGGNTLATSPNGITWTGRGESVFSSYGYNVTNESNLLVAVGQGGNTIASSTDGISWTTLNSSTRLTSGYAISYGNGLYVAVGSSPAGIATSTDVINWTYRGTGGFSTLKGVNYGKDGSNNDIWVAVGYLNSMAYSYDGITWRSCTGSIFNNIGYGVAYGKDASGNGLWVATGDGTITKSNNGIHWRDLRGVLGSGNCIAFGKDGSGNDLWVTGGQGNLSGNNNLASSYDTITWRSVSEANNGGLYYNAKAVAYGKDGSGNGLWVAVGQASGAVVASSVDGISWTYRFNGGGNANVCAVAYGQDSLGNGLWIAYGGNGTNIMRSTNGTTWASHFSASIPRITGLIYNNGLWVASALDTNGIVTSTDGINWTSRGIIPVFTSVGLGIVGPTMVTPTYSTAVLSGFSVPTKTIGDAAFTITPPTSNSDGVFSYTSSNTSVATIAENVITVVGVGTSTITANQSNTTSYSSATITATFTVNKMTPTITNFSVQSKTFGDAAFAVVSPSSNSTGGFTYTSSNTSVATIAGDVVTIVGGGTSTITATQASTADYTSGTTTTTFTVGQATPVISNFSIATKTDGDAAFALVSPTSNSTGAFTYTSSNTLVATVAGNVVTVVGVGTTTITATQASTTNYMSGTITGTLQVKQRPTLGSLSVPAKTFGDAAFTLVQPTSNSTGAFTYASSNTSVATIVGNTVTIVGGGTSTITATQEIAGVYGSLSVTATLTVSQATLTITNFTVPAKSFGDAAFAVVPPTTVSSGAFTYTSSNTSVATVAGSMITVVGVGSSVITATQASTANYTSGTITSTLQVNQGTPVISNFSVPAKTFGNAPFNLTDPTSNSTGAFTYTSSNAAVATIAGNTVTIVGGGTTTITATQASTTNYVSRTVTATLTVSKATPVLSGFSVPDKTMGSPTFVITPPTSTSDGELTYTSSNPSVAAIIGNRIRVAGIGSATITATQATTASFLSGTTSASMQVTGLQTILTILQIPAKTFGDIPFKIQGSSNNSGSPINYSSSDLSVLTIAGDMATIVGGGVVTITASQEPTGTYGPATTTYELLINQITTSLINFSVPVNTVGNAPFHLVAPLSNRAGSFTYSSSSTDVATIDGNMVTIVGAGTSTISATQSGNNNFTSATITATLVVNQGIPTITNFSIPAKVAGDAPFTLTAPTSNSPGAFTYTSSNLTMATVAGNVVTILGTGTCTISAVQASTVSFTAGVITASLVVGRATTTLSNFVVPAKSFGNAPFALTPPTTNSNGTFTYASSNTDVAIIVRDVVTIVGLGTATITANQLATANYTSASTTATLTVSQGAPTLTNFAVPAKKFGDANFMITAPITTGDGAFTYTSSDSAVATVEGDMITIVGAGTATITANQASTTNYASATITSILQVNRITTLLSNFAVSSKTFGDAAFTLTPPTTNSPGDFTYTSSNTAVASINGNTVTIVGGGNATITAVQASTTNYTSATVTATLQVNLQRTNLSNFAVAAKIIGESAFTLTPPTTNSNGAFSYTSSNPDVATIVGNTVTIVGLGSSVITAVQANTSDYTTASIVATFRVGLISTVLTNFVIPEKNIGGAAFNLDAPTSNSSGAFTYTTSNLLVATVAGDIVTIVGVGTCTITAVQAGTFNSTSATITAPLVVNKAETELSNFVIPDKIFGDAPFTLTPPTSNNNGPFTYISSNLEVARIVRNVVTIVGIGTATITANQPATANFTSAAITDVLYVTQAEPTITNFSIPAKTIGDAAFTLVAPTSNSTGAFTYTSSDEEVATIDGNTVTIVGGGTATITAVQDETSNFQFGEITALLTVNRIVTTLSNFTFPAKTFGDEDFTLVPPTTNSDGVFTYTSSDEEVAIVDENGFVVIIGGGSTTITAIQASTPTYRSATATALLQINPIVTVLSNFSVPAKIIGEPSFAIDPPTTESDGALTYTSTNPAVATIEDDVVTIVGLGNTTIIARQASTNNYTSDSITTLFQVKLIRTVLSDFNIPAKTIGDTSFTITPPTTNSTGAFIYSSSNLLMATVAGDVVTVVGTGTVTITAFQESTENSTPARITASLVVNRSTNAISWFSVPEKTLGSAPFTITPPITSSNGAITYSSSNTDVATIVRNVITIVGIGTSTITANQARTVNHAAGSITAIFTVTEGTPVLSNFVVPNKVTGDAPFALVAPTSNSNGEFTYTSSDEEVATVDGNMVTIVGVGSTTITANQESNSNFLSASTTALFTVNKITTVLTNFAVAAKTFGAAPFAITPPTSNNSTGEFTYTSSNTDVASIDGSTITVVGAGSAIITANQASTDQFTSATVNTLLQVDPIRTVLTNFTIPTKIIGEANFAIVHPTTNSNGALTYTSSTPEVATIDGDVITIVGLGTSRITAAQARTTNYTSATVSALLQVNLITTVLTDFAVPAKIVGDAPFSITAPTTNSTGGFTYTSSNSLVATVAGTTITIVGVGTSTITVVQASTPNSTLGTTTAQLVVTRRTPVITNFSIPAKAFGNAAFKITPPTSTGNGAFTYASSNTDVATIAKDMITIVGVGSATITATQASTANFLSGTITATLEVSKGTPGLSAFAVPPKTFGDATFTIAPPQSNSNGAITYSSSNPEVATIDGNTVTIVGGGTTTITADQASTATYLSETITASFQVNRATTVLTNFSVPSMASGNPAFNITPPTSNSDGAFTYTSSRTTVATIEGNLVTIVGGGVSTITAVQAATTNYTSATVTTQFQVSSLTTVLSNFTMPTKAVGDAPFAIVPPTTNGDGAFTYTSSSQAVATVVGNVVTIVGAGSVTITAVQASTPNYTSATITALMIVNKGAPVLGSFVVPAKEIGMADFSVANPTSTSPGVFTYTSSNRLVAIINNGNTISIKGLGTSIITATQAMTTNYIAATVTATFQVNQLSPTMSNFTIPATANVGDKTFKIVAPKSNSISKFVYTSSDITVATIKNDVVTIVGAGTTTITATQPATKSFGPGIRTATLQVNKKTTVMVNFSIPAKIIGTAAFTIPPPTSTGNGAITYTSSNTEVATIVGNQITMLTTGTTTITASQAATANFTSGTISTTLVVSLPNPQVGTMIIPNTSLTSPTFTITDPSKPNDSTGTWTYTSSNTDIATVTGNAVTLLQPGIVTISAVLSSDSLYNSALLMTQFAVSDINVITSTFAFVRSSVIMAAIPTTLVPVSRSVTLPPSFSTPANIAIFNPRLGALVERQANQNMLTSTFFYLFPTAFTVVLPSTAIYLPPAISITKFKTTKVVRPTGSTVNSPLIINAVASDATVVFLTSIVEVGNGVQINGVGSFAGYFVRVVKGENNRYMVTRTNKTNVSVSNIMVRGDTASFAGITIAIGFN
jgi:hypothetical protein